MVFHVRICVVTLLSWILLHRVRAQRNVTLDDQDPAIIYAPAGVWTPSDKNSLDYGGSHTLTSDHPGATATLTFTGTAIYYLSPLWPYLVNTAISLDSGPVTLVDLQDHSRSNTGQGSETVQSQVVWSATGLTNTQHTLVISIGQGQPYGIVDGLIYTVGDTASSSSSSSVSTVPSIPSTGTTRIAPSATSSDGSSATSASGSNVTSASGSTAPKRKFNLYIVLGSVFGVVILLLIFVIVWLSRRKNRAQTINGAPHNGNPPATNGNGNEQAYQRHGGAGEGQALLHGYPVMDGSDGTWQNARHGFVGNMPPPPLGTLHPAQQQPYYAHPQGTSQNGYYDQSANQLAPNRNMPAYTPSSIIERSRSTPLMGAYSPSLATSASMGAITHPHGYSGPDGTQQNARHSFVGNMAPPPITALHPAQQQPYYDPYQNGYYDSQSASNRAPNRPMSAHTLSSSTEASMPLMGVYSPQLTASTSIGANTLASFRTEELSGYPAAPASQSSGGGVQPAAGDGRDAYPGVQPSNEKGEKSNIQQPPSNQETTEAPPSYSI